MGAFIDGCSDAMFLGINVSAYCPLGKDNVLVCGAAALILHDFNFLCGPQHFVVFMCWCSSSNMFVYGWADPIFLGKLKSLYLDSCFEPTEIQPQ